MRPRTYLKYGSIATSILFTATSLFSQSPVIDQDVPEKAQVFATDLIVQGSECVGIDCVNSESFGFDTQRYKENNLRLHFDDTSNSASFPSNDWRIQINDSSNGGASYFAVQDATANRIPFRIEAGAPNHSLYVDDAGNVGMGTNNPALQAHIVDGNSPALRLEQDGSSGFTAQTWDLAGNEANFFIRDVTNGSKLPFQIRPGAPTKSLDIRADGDVSMNNNVGIGLDDPLQKLHIKSTTSDSYLRLESTGAAGNANWDIGNVNGRFVIVDPTGTTQIYRIFEGNTAANTFVIRNDNVGIGLANPVGAKMVVQGDFNANGEVRSNGVALTSDARLKKDIHDLDGALNVLDKLQPKSYLFRTDEFTGLNLPTEQQYGFLAQDVEKVMPELVKNGLIEPSENEDEDGTQYKGLNYVALVPILVQGVKEQQTEIEDLKKENEEMRAELEALKKLVYEMAGKGNAGAINTQTSTLSSGQLAQNQPNPFSENTTIRYSIPNETRRAEMRITDQEGKVIKSIPIEAKGEGQTILQAHSLNAGTYFYTLMLDGQVTETKQMVLTK